MIVFNRPHVVGTEFAYIEQAIADGRLAGNGGFGRRCGEWLEQRLGCHKALITPSCTAALELCALLADIRSGDEVIMPSYTFVSTANAFALRGGIPVFVDIRPDTMNLDERLIEEAITERTRAIVVVHYAGVSCAMDEIMRIAERHGLIVIEDAAHALLSAFGERPLGSIGHLGTLSFHETKNVHCGEGGALLVNDERFVQRAEILQEKGTNRARFFRGEIDRYTWVDVGSSPLLSDISSAFLWAQLEHADDITAARMEIWETYHRALEGLDAPDLLRRPVVPPECSHNAHMYYLLLEGSGSRDAFIRSLAADGVQAVFHYVPLHSSPAGARWARAAAALPATELAGAQLVRLPLWIEMTDAEIERVVGAVRAAADVASVRG
jgi:dTDP-4-amino-4,6-dideoxygalactose transaminase